MKLKNMLLIGGAAAVVTGVAVLAARSKSEENGGGNGGTQTDGTLQVKTPNPVGASIIFDYKSILPGTYTVAPGTYNWSAQADGYVTMVGTITVISGETAVIDANMTPVSGGGGEIPEGISIADASVVSVTKVYNPDIKDYENKWRLFFRVYINGDVPANYYDGQYFYETFPQLSNAIKIYMLNDSDVWKTVFNANYTKKGDLSDDNPIDWTHQSFAVTGTSVDSDLGFTPNQSYQYKIQIHSKVRMCEIPLNGRSEIIYDTGIIEFIGNAVVPI